MITHILVILQRWTSNPILSQNSYLCFQQMISIIIISRSKNLQHTFMTIYSTSLQQAQCSSTIMHNSSCYNMVRRVKHLDNMLTFMPVQCTGVIFSFIFFSSTINIYSLAIPNLDPKYMLIIDVPIPPFTKSRKNKNGSIHVSLTNPQNIEDWTICQVKGSTLNNLGPNEVHSIDFFKCILLKHVHDKVDTNFLLLNNCWRWSIGLLVVNRNAILEGIVEGGTLYCS